jgi:hypothetical protein
MDIATGYSVPDSKQRVTTLSVVQIALRFSREEGSLINFSQIRRTLDELKVEIIQR